MNPIYSKDQIFVSENFQPPITNLALQINPEKVEGQTAPHINVPYEDPG